MENVREQIRELYKILSQVWSLESSSKWTPENPAKGQCGVTALVVNDLFGGEILKTMVAESWHFYNRINGMRCDLTETQFEEPIHYMDIQSTREEAFLDTNETQYQFLKHGVYRQMGGAID